MATAAPPAAPYDDGSSTESEYYFDPREEAEEAAAYAWTHEHDAPKMQEPINHGNEDNTVIKQEYREYGQLQQDVEKITLPQGSEWSHGAASTTVYDNVVQQALAMAQNLTEAQREEPLTDDTMNSNASPRDHKEEIQEKQEKVVVVWKKKEVKAKPKLVSLKKVKTPASPASMTKAVAVGLRRSPSKVEGVSSEVQKELSVSRPKWKSTESQTSSHKASPRHNKVAQSKVNDEKKAIRKEGTNKSPSVRKFEHDKVSSSRRTEHSKSQTNRKRSRSRSPSICRRKRSRSPSVRRKNHSRSPSRRTVHGNHERSFSSRRYSRRSPSRSPSSRRFTERRRRSRSRSPRSTGRRSIQSHKQPRSPSPVRYHSNRRSRSRSWDRHERHDKRPRNDSRSYDKRKMEDPRCPSHREYREVQLSRDTIQRQDRNNHSARLPKDMNGKGERSSGMVVQVNTNRTAAKPRLQEVEPIRSSRPVVHNGACISAMSKTVETLKRNPKVPRITPGIGMVAANPGKVKAPIHGHIEHHDPFERRVFKLKLQEADMDEKLSGKPLTEAERALYERRLNKIGLERARLENQDLERFEKLYATTKVTDVALKRYQDNRDFAWRVMCFKQRQSSLQQQKELFVSEEVQREKWRQLDEDREKLMAENAYMFHTVMMNDEEEFQHKENARHSGKCAIGNGNQREFKHRASEVIRPNYSDSTRTSRVVVGAALQLQGGRVRSNTFDPLRARPKNTPWFLKG
ncbi:hypothetical protein L916_20196 [Phytophthora nicotianae]|uniref:Uncharacterized protein n=1 Tax=Phytophthora nicotianae TaxID=4792 RepID=W2HW02_PHYNI|nr:hypothetical protein L916_20196 [Phytophthora nicotianae]